MSVDHSALTDAVNSAANAPTFYEAQKGIVECLRAVIRPTPPFRQADILYHLRDLANAPGFTRLSLLAAIDYLAEGNRVTGVILSEWGLNARMREEVKE